MKRWLPLVALLATGCASVKNQEDLKPIAANAAAEEVVMNITATCAGFAKAGVEKGYGGELSVFNECMDEAVKILERTEY